MNITFSESLNSRVKGLAIQPGANFLSGGQTSGVAQGISSSILNVVNAGGTILQAGPLITEIVASCVQEVSTELLSYVTVSIGKLLTMPANKIAQKISESTTKLTYTPQDIINNLTTGWDKVISDAATASINESTEKMQDDCNQTAEQISYKTTNTIDNINSSIESIVTYIGQGPEWIQDKLTTFCNTLVDNAEKEIGETVKNAEKNRDNWVESIANFTALKIVKPINDSIEEKLKRQYESINEAKQKQMSVASASVKAELMNIIGMLGN